VVVLLVYGVLFLVLSARLLFSFFSTAKRKKQRKRRPWPKCSTGSWDGYTLVCCGLQGTTEQHGAGF
jgi:hypothetical protein